MPTEYGVRLPTWRVPSALTATGVRGAAATATFPRHPADSCDRPIRPTRTTARAPISLMSESPLEISLGDPECQERLLILIVRVGCRGLFLQHILEQRRFQRVLVGHHTKFFL